ncbi:C40 family peptidase [Ornithinimicrobium sp. W1665]|uniref:C40 family peptidase n=1 Tax=Ornithinimicrobium sp. W1665 TaxID=3416666 RepID=UPI003CEDFEA3
MGASVAVPADPLRNDEADGPARALQALLDVKETVAAERPAAAAKAPTDASVEFGTAGFTAATEVARAPEAPETAADALGERESTTASRSTERAAAPVQQDEAPVQESGTPAQLDEAPVRQSVTPVQQASPVQQAAPAPVGGGVVAIARQYVGYPYVLGGTPPYSFDCSSFTWWVFQQAGIDIPRTVSGQKAAVTPVSDPQPGDLVFTEDFYHVGIYAGNGLVVEALNPSTDVTYGAPVYGGIWYGRIG